MGGEKCAHQERVKGDFTCVLKFFPLSVTFSTRLSFHPFLPPLQTCRPQTSLLFLGLKEKGRGQKRDELRGCAK